MCVVCVVWLECVVYLSKVLTMVPW